MVNRWGLKDLYFGVCRHKEELAVRGESNRSDRVSEVKVRNHHSLDHIDDQGKAIHIYADQSSLIWRQLETRDVASVLEGQGLGNVGRQVEDIDLVSDWTQQELVNLVSIRSRSFL